MKTAHFGTLLYAILFLFTLQMAGTLVESIYILDLLNTSLDEKALGLLFFFTPILLYFFKKKPAWLMWLALGMLLVARGITPYLGTSGRLLSSGMATGAALTLIPLLFAQTPADEQEHPALAVSAGLALSAALSILLRTIAFGLDYSLTAVGSWFGWLLAVGLGWLFLRLKPAATSEEKSPGFSAGFGSLLLLSLLLFAFSAPAVIARWTGANDTAIILTTSVMTLVYTIAALSFPDWILKLIDSKALLRGLNLLFGAALVATILAHQVAFPLAPENLPVVVTQPDWYQQIPLVVTLLLLPILFVDAALILDCAPRTPRRTRSFLTGTLMGTVTLVLLVFMQIFTNVWGYVEPVSPFFRSKFWLPYLLMSGLLLLLVLNGQQRWSTPRKMDRHPLPLAWGLILAAVFLQTAFFSLWVQRPPQMPEDKTSLTVMTYNIQQANDDNGQKSYLRQLALIREINPDILALQESDSPRVSLNNNDYVRYYASQLGYYSYYGPATVTGTYGTALLSRYPLENVRTVFSFSDTDEIGTTEAEIVVDGRRFTLFNIHPDGSDTAMMTFAETLLNRSRGLENVIALGDYNLRSHEAAYQAIAAVYHNVPDSEGHIDHIFLSYDLQMLDPVYLPAPQSATDHPLLYATVTWE